MRKYSIHPIYPIVLGILLVLGTDTSIHEILDPTYHVISAGGFGIARYIPRAVMWYLFAYGWWKFSTAVYSVEIEGNEKFILKSLIKKEIVKFADVTAARRGELFVNIYYKNRKSSIIRLIDGIADITSIFEGIIPQAFQAEVPTERTAIRTFKIFFGILLILIAVYVELEQFALRKQ